MFGKQVFSLSAQKFADSFPAKILAKTTQTSFVKITINSSKIYSIEISNVGKLIIELKKLCLNNLVIQPDNQFLPKTVL